MTQLESVTKEAEVKITENLEVESIFYEYDTAKCVRVGNW